jgi:hypothetical protein
MSIRDLFETGLILPKQARDFGNILKVPNMITIFGVVESRV